VKKLLWREQILRPRIHTDPLVKGRLKAKKPIYLLLSTLPETWGGERGRGRGGGIQDKDKEDN
jgi:hypothetical protein